ncbi:MAG: VWA domain-containing protein [Anaerolineales bacterium]|nr:VWA domain-containing protein [Anaerolineales bacterium]
MLARKWSSFLLLSILFAWVGLQPCSQAAAQGDIQVRITQVDNSQFPRVTVYVSVTNAAGEPVGVDPATIQIFENGEAVAPVDMRGGGELLGGESIPVTTMLVMDISGSMEKNDKIGAAKEAARSYVNAIRSGDQVGIISYDTHVYTVQPVTSDIPTLVTAIDGLQTGSDTAMYNALMEAEMALENVTDRKAIIVLTDGMDNQSIYNAEDVVNGIGESGLSISAIGFGDINAAGQEGLDEEGLKFLAEMSGGQYAFATDAQTLNTLYHQYGQSLQSEYAITYISPATLRDGINRQLTVSLTEVGVLAEEAYNPGGVLPEVSSSSWPLFGGILVVLLVLLVVPLAINRIVQAFSPASSGDRASKRPKGRIKMDRPPMESGKRPRVKLK